MRYTKTLSVIAIASLSGCFLVTKAFEKNEPRLHPNAKKPALAAASQNTHVAVPVMCGRYQSSNKTTRNLLSKVVLPKLWNALHNGQDPTPTAQLNRRNRGLVCNNFDLAKLWKNERRATNTLMMPLRELDGQASSYFLTTFSIDQDCWTEANEIRGNDGRVIATTNHRERCKDAGTALFQAAWIDKSGTLLWWGSADCGKRKKLNFGGSSTEVSCGEDDQQTQKFIDTLLKELPSIGTAPQAGLRNPPATTASHAS